uniref:Prospero homeobox 1 n=1 Tax=Malacoceros fuliginosus TaxID=271776 RepID=A0A7G9UKZ3_MALFL|nr:prospero homeobox 1 [Malacoceros fuliginosus]
MVENGHGGPSSASMHNSDSEYTSDNLQSVTDLLKERLVRRGDDTPAATDMDRTSPSNMMKNTDYISDSGAVSENGVQELTSMVNRHVHMMSGYNTEGNDENNDSTVLRGMLRKDEQSQSVTSDSNTGNSSMIGKLLQREHESTLVRTSSFDIDVDGDSMPSITTPNDFSSEELSDGENTPRSPNDFMREDEEFNEELNLSGSSSQSKRARVENIINTMNRSSSPVKETPVTPIDQRRHKRKQYTPQQHESSRPATSNPDEPNPKMRRLEQDVLEKQLKVMQDQLVVMQQKYTDLYQQHHEATAEEIDLAEVERRCHQRQQIINGMQEKENKIHELSKRHGLLGPVELDSSHFMRETRKLVNGKMEQIKSQFSPLSGDTPKDLENLAVLLKNEIRSSVGTLVDTVFARFVEESKKVKDDSPETKTANIPEAAKESKADLPSPSLTKEKPSPSAIVEKTRTPTPQLHLPQPSPQQSHPSPQPHHQQQQQQHHQQQQQPPLPQAMLSHSIHKITNNNNNNNEVKPITIVPKHQPMENSAFHPSPEKHSPNDKMPRIEQPKPTRTKVTDKIMHPFFDHHKPSFADLLRHAPLFPPPPPYFHHLPHHLPHMFQPHQHKIAEPEPEQTEPISLVVNTPKKKRTKVTDTRLSPRAARALLQEPVPEAPNGSMDPMHFNGEALPANPPSAPLPPHSSEQPRMMHPSLLPVSLPTSVAIPNPSLQHSDILSNMYHGSSAHHELPHPASFPDFSARVPTSRSPSVRDHGSPSMHPHEYGMFGRDADMFDGENSTNLDGYPMTTTLTPMHLRKAKLMFFYTRYPSSSIIKVYFPDIKFNKNNTAQLVKWFSNFREFYYIQMEKYSRQALAEGVKNPEDLIVTTDSELYRVLNLHYNRNNQLEVPESFRIVVQATLREFFKSIHAGKDTEQSWKKSIYKIIARMDDSIPEYFKSPNWMEQLNDN